MRKNENPTPNALLIVLFFELYPPIKSKSAAVSSHSAFREGRQLKVSQVCGTGEGRRVFPRVPISASLIISNFYSGFLWRVFAIQLFELLDSFFVKSKQPPLIIVHGPCDVFPPFAIDIAFD